MNLIFTVECPPGTYYKEKTCKPCPLGYFQPQRGALSCIACDKDFTTSHTGTKYSDKCVFKPLEGNFHESDREAFGGNFHGYTIELLNGNLRVTFMKVTERLLEVFWRVSL